MKKAINWVILIIALVVIMGLVLILILNSRSSDNVYRYSCNLDSDCVSQCQNGCVNFGWATSHPDTSECFRAWDCSCVNNQCYTDGKPRS